ncbi:MAG: hypothetical protein PVS3B2_00070 [Candidatus Dormibacteraceae bacterium]
MHIGQRIKNVMKQRKVSTAEMARYCEVSRGAVSNWFATGRITKENLAKVSDRLRVRIEDLISGAIGEREDSPLPTEHRADDAAEKAPGTVLLVDEIELALHMRELLPEDREHFKQEITARAAQMRKHAEMVLKRAGVSAPVSDARVAAFLPPAPAGSSLTAPVGTLSRVKEAQQVYQVFVRKNAKKESKT